MLPKRGSACPVCGNLVVLASGDRRDEDWARQRKVGRNNNTPKGTPFS